MPLTRGCVYQFSVCYRHIDVPMGINLVDIMVRCVVVDGVIVGREVDGCGDVFGWMEGSREGMVVIDATVGIDMVVKVVVVVSSMTGEVSIVRGPFQSALSFLWRQGLLLLLLVFVLDNRGMHLLQPLIGRFGCGLTTAWWHLPKGSKKRYDEIDVV